MRFIRPRAVDAVLVLVTLMLTTSVVARAAVSPIWLELGGSASGDGVSGAIAPAAARDASVAVGADGLPVVTYTEYPDAVSSRGAITVKRWTGTTWETLSGPTGLARGYAPQVKIAASGAIHVAWLHDGLDGSTEIRLRVRTGTTFDELGGSDSPGGISGTNPGVTAPFSLALDGAGHPLVAFVGAARNGFAGIGETPQVVNDTRQIYVRRWTGSAWQFVGSDFAGGGASNARSFSTAAATIQHDADTPALVVDSHGSPVVAFTYSTIVDGAPNPNTDVYVTRWNGTAWTAVGPAVPAGDSPAGAGGAGGVSASDTGSFNPSIAAGPDGSLALAWEEDTPAGATYLWVRAWKGVQWLELGGSASNGGLVAPQTVNEAPRIAVRGANPIVAWQRRDLAMPSQIFVLQWTGAAWEDVGLDSAANAGISDAALHAVTPALALAPGSGVPVVAWVDSRQQGGSQVFLRRAEEGQTGSVEASLASTLRLALRVGTPPGVSGQGAVGTIQGPDGVCGVGGGDACEVFVASGTRVLLVAAAQPGNRFLGWSGGPCNGRTNTSCAFTLTTNASTVALFRAVTGVRVTKAGNGAGTVSGIGFACGTDCFAEVFTATGRVLTATPAVGSRFLGWSGDACSGQATGSCTVVAAGLNQSITATFQLTRHSLTVVNRVNGRVESLPPLPAGTIDCGGGSSVCSRVLDYGTPVVLRASPIFGTRFVRWAGTVCDGRTNATCEFRMAGNVSLAPNYRNVTTLSLNKSGLGTIGSTPAGISCSLACSAATFDFARGALVRLLATPRVGWSFNGFTGDCTGPTCTINASAETAFVGASFSIQSRRLRVTVVGNGSVSGDGLVCDPSTTPCAQDYDYGTTLPLSPVAAPGYRFTGWTQHCLGASATTCRPLLTANRSVTAIFRPVFTLTVTKTGNSNSGAITSTPAGINCGVTVVDCSQTYLGGTAVTLVRSAPVTGTIFRWLGACAFRGTNATCVLPMNANVSVVGEYRLRPLGLTVANLGPRYGTVTRVNGTLDCGATCSEVVNYGTPVTLRATAAATPASEFVSWTGCTPATNASCTFSLTANRTVTARFRPLVTSLAVQAPIEGPIVGGGTRQLSAIATFSDLSQQDVTGQTTTTTWSATSTPAGVVTVSTTGLITGRLVGNASVRATFRRGTQVVVSDPIVIRVSTLIADAAAPGGRAIKVACFPYGEPAAPASQLACLPSNRRFEVHCRAFGHFAGGGPPADITDQVAWRTTNALIARPTGLVAFTGPLLQSFRMTGAGTAALYASVGTRRSATAITNLGTAPWVVQGSPQTVVGTPVIQPFSPTVAVDGHVQLQAIATLTGAGACASPPARDFALLVNWASDNEGVADISFFGQATGVSEGSVTIRATYGTMPLDPVTLVVQSP